MTICLNYGYRPAAKGPRYFPRSDGLTSAPGGIRTPGRLLRRQLLCPAELRAPERNCAWPRSHEGHAKVAVCRPLAAQIRPRARQQPTVPEPCVNDENSATPKPPTCGSAPTPRPPPPTQGPAQSPRAVAPRTQPHGPSGPDSPQREKNAHEAAAALGPRGSEYRAEPGSAEPPDQ